MPPVISRRRSKIDPATSRKLLGGIHAIHELIVDGEPLGMILDEIVKLIDQCIPHTRSSFMLIDEDKKRLRSTSHGQLPKSYCDAIDGLLIQQDNGACGTAACRKEMVIVSDISKDPFFKDFRELCEKHQIRSCWSTPILSSPTATRSADNRTILGTFAIYGSVCRKPTANEIEVVQKLVNLTAIAIERDLLHKLEEAKKEFNKKGKINPDESVEIAELRTRWMKLSNRQRQVLSQVARGIASKMIAQNLGISEKTVSHHRSTLLLKMKADNTAALVRMLGQLGELE